MQQYDMQPSGSIEIEGLMIFARHGVLPQERTVGNMFEVSLSLTFPCTYAMRTDRVDLTINYADVIEIIRQEMNFPSKLLENVAYRIYQTLTMRYPQITGGRVAIYKTQPPISAELKKVGFAFSW